MATLPAKPDSDVLTPVSYESLLEACELILDNLGSPELSSRTIQWDNFPALMKLWEVLWQAQASLVQEAERLGTTHEATRAEQERLFDVKAALNEIRAGKHEERDRHFALGLYWRRHAIWRYFRTHLDQPEQARDLLHLYLVKPVGGGQQTGETCRPKCNTKAEQALLLDLASKQRNRIRQLAQWLTDHPEAASLLRDAKGKGKGKARDAADLDIVMKQKAHFERCLEEVEPKERLKELIAATDDWVTCCKSRLEAVHIARTALAALQKRQTSVPRERSPTTKAKRSSTGATFVEVQVPQMSKRRRTIDRGTSPIPELIDNSIYLEQSREYGGQNNNPKVIDRQAEASSVLPATLTQETALRQDDSPPSPQSLPSPPPHAQVRQGQQPQNVADESQQSTTDSSLKVPSLPSVQSLPPIQSSSSGEDSFRITAITEMSTVARVNGSDREADSITKITVKPAKRPKKRSSKLPPITPEIQQLLEQAAMEAEKKRREEKARLGEFDYDPWEDLQDWVPPGEQVQSVRVSEAAQLLAKQGSHDFSMTGERSDEMHTAKSHFPSFEAIEADGSEIASLGRQEREDDEAGITEFLRSEDL